jgi:hypothetical protein
MFSKTLAATLLLTSLTGQGAAQTCSAPGPASPLGPRLAEIAQKEYRLFNGHRIDARGRLWKFGSAETETEPLLHPETGEEDAQAGDRFAWRRVWRYWQTLDLHQPGTSGSRRIKWAHGLLEEPNQAGSTQLSTLRQVRNAVAAATVPDEIVQEALVRTAISDSPWSAAFISFLMHEAEVPDSMFRYSSAHALYIQPALNGSTPYAYRACDPRTTRPRAGDLLCYARGTNPYRTLQNWQSSAGQLDGRVQSHCDLVVSVDFRAAKMESVGGNVLQSVTRRQLMLNTNGVLSDTHIASRHPIVATSACGRDKTCHKENLNLQHWSVLLQLR